MDSYTIGQLIEFNMDYKDILQITNKVGIIVSIREYQPSKDILYKILAGSKIIGIYDSMLEDYIINYKELKHDQKPNRLE